VWDPRQHIETKVAIKIHCISTEFTAKKHGGEKGVPFRIQVETYTYSASPSDNVPLLLNCASCQVKVFKPKGADRKHKTDREKIERRSNSEKEKYQPSYECTVLTEIPLDQVHKYLELLNRQQDEDERRSKESAVELSSSPAAVVATAVTTALTPPISSSVTLRPTIGDVASLANSDCSCPSFADVSHSSSPPAEVRLTQLQATSPTVQATTPVSVSNLSTSRKRPSETSLCIAMNRSSSQLELTNKDTLLVTATAEEVTAWLSSHRFANFLHVFQDFSGSDLLRLCREDLIQICGTADGIRLFNALQAKTVRPKLTIYVCQLQTSTVPADTTRLWRDQRHTNQSHIKFRSRSSTPSPTPPFLTTESTVFFKSDQVVTCVKDDTNSVVGSRDTNKSSLKCDNSVLCRTSDLSSLCSDIIASSSATAAGGSLSGVVFSTSSSSSVERRETASQTTCLAAKRQMTERDEDEDDEVSPSLSANKKQRMQSVELGHREVYHALYLDCLTEYHLREKLALLYDILPTQILELYLQGPSGIHILVTDLVVQNFKDQSSFIIEVVPETAGGTQYRVILKYVDLV
jgi:hypothetical protein